MARSYYAVLGVQPGASAAEIRAAYHRLAMVSAATLILAASGRLPLFDRFVRLDSPLFGAVRNGA